MSFGNTLRNLRSIRNMTQFDLANKVGVSVVCVGNWEREVRKPTMDALRSISLALNVSADTLLELPAGEQEPLLTKAEHDLLDNYRALNFHGKLIVDTVCSIEKDHAEEGRERNSGKVVPFRRAESSDRYIPKYTSPSAAGFNTPLDGDDFEMILVDDSVPEEADYAIRVQGNSMEPYIHDGDIVFVNKNAELAVGDVGIFCVDGAMYCKQYYVDSHKNLVLVSANPEMKSSNIHISKDGGRSVRLCGKVLLRQRIGLPEYLRDGEE